MKVTSGCGEEVGWVGGWRLGAAGGGQSGSLLVSLSVVRSDPKNSLALSPRSWAGHES